jgi:hypothetical protein
MAWEVRARRQTGPPGADSRAATGTRAALHRAAPPPAPAPAALLRPAPPLSVRLQAQPALGARYRGRRQYNRPAYVVPGKRAAISGHCTNSLSAARVTCRMRPDSDSRCTRAMLSTYTMRQSNRQSALGGGAGRGAGGAGCAGVGRGRCARRGREGVQARGAQQPPPPSLPRAQAPVQGQAAPPAPCVP